MNNGIIEELLSQLAINSLKGNVYSACGRLEIESTPANGYWLRYKAYGGEVWESYTHPSRVSEKRLRYDYRKLWKAAYLFNENTQSRVRRIS